MAGFGESNGSTAPTAPPMQWFGTTENGKEPPRYQSLALEHSQTHRTPTAQYPKSPRSRRNTLTRSIAFAGTSVGHFFGVHDDPTNRGWRRTGTLREDANTYSVLPNLEGRAQEQVAAATPPQREQSRFSSSLTRARTLLRLKKREPTRKEVLESLPKFWPVMTVLIALIEVGLLIAVTVVFGLAPIAFTPQTEVHSIVGFDNQTDSLSRDIVPNFFIGPSSASLIHSGAMYTPCIRDNREFQLLNARTSFEENTLRCCKSAATEQCGMLPQHICIGDRYNGGVLGGASPCRAENNNTVQCTGGVVLHPCCVGLLGQCVITTSDNCSFQDGFWHPDKILCSEVDCFSDVCRFDWINRTIGEIPDQGLRFISAIFLNHGVITLVIIGLIKFYNSWVIERRIGFLRFICIYLISGVGGFLLSGIFDPTSVSVGSSGPLFGLLGVLLVELVQGWKYANKPWLELIKLVVLILVLLAVGTLPYVDNFSQVGGFIFGVLASFIFVPYITLGKWDRAIKLCLVLTALPIILALFLFGFVVFYFNSNPNFCPECSYFSCIPWTPTFCDEFISTILSVIPTNEN